MQDSVKKLSELVFSGVLSGVPSNLVYDGLKLIWTQLTKQSWEDLFRHSMEEVITEERKRLSKYTNDGDIDFDSKAFLETINESLADGIGISYSSFAHEEMLLILAKMLADRNALILGGNTLSSEEYRSLIEKLIRLTREKFKQAVTSHPTVFQEVLLNETLLNQEQSSNIEKYLRTELSIELAKVNKTLESLPENTAAEVISALGKRALSPFVLPEQFFHRWLYRDHLFNHLWSFEGRTDTLGALKAFSDSSETQVALLIGRGGIGKTKILKEFSDTLNNTKTPVYFIEEGIKITLDSGSRLPSEKCIIVMDDAHRHTEDIATLCRLLDIRAQAGNCPIKLVLSLRPHALQTVEAKLSREGLRYCRLDEIKELSKTAREALARQALGTQHSHLASSLSSIAHDSPLVIVVGGQLVASQSIPINLISRQEDFRREVFNRFEDVVFGEVSKDIDRESCRKLLELLSAITPIRVDDAPFLDTASDFLQIDKITLKKQLGILEESGILLRKGNRLRITPDVLADHILHKACLTPQGIATGYARSIFEKFRDGFSSQVVYNLAELDWQIKFEGEQRSNQLVSDILKELEREFRDSPASDQYSLLENVNGIAYHQPAYALGIVQFVMRHPADTVPPEGQVPLYNVKHEHLLAKLPKILRKISFHIEYVTICCNLLWNLGRNDPKRPHNSPPEAIRFLKELAAYDLYKPFAFNREVLNAIQTWLQTSNVHSGIYSPLDILDPLLERYIEHHEFDGRSLGITYAPLAYRQVKEIREEVLQIIEDLLGTEECSVTLRALESLLKPLERLRIPRSSQKELEAADKTWEPEQLKILEIVASFVSQEREAILLLMIIDKVKALSKKGASLSIQKTADDILSSIGCTEKIKLTGVLVGDYVWDVEASQRKENRQEHDNDLIKARSEVASAFVDSYPDYIRGLKALEERISTIVELEGSVNHRFFRTLSENHPKYALSICEAILTKESSSVAAYLHPLLYSGRKIEPKRTAEVVKTAIESGDASLCLSFASYYYSWDSYFIADELYTLALSLLTHSDPKIKKPAMEQLGCLAQFTPDVAVRLALAVETNNESKLLNAVFSVFDSVDFEKIPGETFQVLLRKLENVDSLEEHYIQSFLDKAIHRSPSDVIETIIKRIEVDDLENATNKNILPLTYYYKSCLAELPKTEEYPELLNRIRDRWFTCETRLRELPEQEHSSADTQEERRKERLYKSLYKEASLCHAEGKSVEVTTESITLLREWVESGDEFKTTAVSKLISCFNSDFVFSHTDLVCDLLNQSDNISEDCYNTVYNNLWIISLTPKGASFIGEGSPEKIALRDQAKEVAAQSYKGSPVYHFFESIAEQAESEIEYEKNLCEELYP